MPGSRAFHALALALAALLATCGGRGSEERQPTRIRWRFQASAPIYYASPALSADGSTVYFGTSSWLYASPAADQALYALSTVDGSVRWAYPLGSGEVRSAPAVGPDGAIAFVVETRDVPGAGQASDLLHRVSASGALDWTFDVDPTHVTLDVGLSAPAIGADGTVYVLGDRLWAVGADGEERWHALEPAGELHRSSPVIGADGTVYVASHNLPLTAFDPATGEPRWSRPLGVNDHVFSSPAIGADGTLYVATQPGLLYAVTSAGEIAWTFDIASAGFQGWFRSSPAVGADGTIYLGLNAGSPSSALFAITSEGAVRWIFEPDDLPADVPPDHFDIYSSPALGADGAVYFGQEFGRIYALDAADGTPRWMQATTQGITWSSPALGPDGTLYIGDLSGGCYAVDTRGPGLDPAAPWPRYRGDLQNTGRKP